MENPVTSIGSTQGDVLLVLSPKHILRVHSNILRESCQNLAVYLTEEKAATLVPKARSPTTIRWRIDLREGLTQSGNVKTGKSYSFESGKIDDQGHTERVFFPDAPWHSDIDTTLLEALRYVVELFYREPIEFGSDSTLRSILEISLPLISAAAILGASKVVGDCIERALINCSEPVWRHIAYGPTEWLILSYHIQARTFFKDALIHTVGKWKLLSADDHARVAKIESVRLVVQRKLVRSWIFKKDQERLMLAYYPDFIKELKNDGRSLAGVAPGRTAYSSHIFGWVALSLFRQWLPQMIIEGANFRAADGGYILYTAMSKGGSEYLKRDEMNSFYDIFPMTDKAKTIINNALTVIKDGMKECVAPLILKGAQYNEVKWLTSCEVIDEDCPWIEGGVVEPDTEVEAFLKRYTDLAVWLPKKVINPPQGSLQLDVGRYLAPPVQVNAAVSDAQASGGDSNKSSNNECKARDDVSESDSSEESYQMVEERIADQGIKRAAKKPAVRKNGKAEVTKKAKGPVKDAELLGETDSEEDLNAALEESSKRKGPKKKASGDAASRRGLPTVDLTDTTMFDADIIHHAEAELEEESVKR